MRKIRNKNLIAIAICLFVLVFATFLFDGIPSRALGQSSDSAIVLFNRAECPTAEGWNEAAEAKGRYLVGLRSTGVVDADIGAQVGDNLDDTENRAVGDHKHRVQDNEHSHTYTRRSGQENSTGQGENTADTTAVNGNTSSESPNVSVEEMIAPSYSVDVIGTPAPYIQLLICKKDLIY